MKLIIAGSRTIRPCTDFIDGIIHQFGLYNIEEVVTGGAKGVDEMGHYWASRGNSSIELPAYFMGVNTKVFEADWNLYGNRAGPIRNKKMAVYADALLLIWDGKSRGSANMKQTMKELGKPVYEIILK